MTCKELDCDKKVIARGWCKMHYTRWYNYGDVSVVNPVPSKHGAARRVVPNASEYGVWKAMKQRCLNLRAPAYQGYGAKGVTVCPQWVSSFESFLVDVGRRPSLIHSLDRYPNRHGNYEPGNVRWATPSEQARNSDRAVLLTLGDVSMYITDWADAVGTSK